MELLFPRSSTNKNPHKKPPAYSLKIKQLSLKLCWELVFENYMSFINKSKFWSPN